MTVVVATATWHKEWSFRMVAQKATVGRGCGSVNKKELVQLPTLGLPASLFSCFKAQEAGELNFVRSHHQLPQYREKEGKSPTGQIAVPSGPAGSESNKNTMTTRELTLLIVVAVNEQTRVDWKIVMGGGEIISRQKLNGHIQEGNWRVIWDNPG